MSNQLTAHRPKFSIVLQQPNYQKLINDTLQDPKRAQRFIASVSSAVGANPDLQECDAGSVLTCALLGESLELSPSPQLGQYYMVPFEADALDANGNIIYLLDEKGNKIKNDKGYYEKKRVKKATFVLGYKGYIQLAIRSGQYKKLNVIAIKHGELKAFNALTEEIEVHLIEDEIKREATETIGYFAMFEYINGFRKAMYWSRDKMEQHALKYSKGYASDKKKGTKWTFWSKDFDGMAYKTMLRQLISKWGVMSIEMRQAFEGDENAIQTDGAPQYIGDGEPIEAETVDIPQPEEQEPPQVSMADLE